MSLATSLSLLQPLRSLKLATTSSNTFIHGTTPLSLLSKPANCTFPRPQSQFGCLPPIRAMRSMQGRVVCATNDKTVSVEVTRLAPHPKYKRRVKIKKKFQAHDPDNRFKVGDVVQLQKSRPISKTKAFVAVPIPVKEKKAKGEKSEGSSGGVGGGDGLGLPLESQQQA